MEIRPYSLTDELYLVFQPIINLQTKNHRETKDFEILLRSNKTDRYPADIIDMSILYEDKNKELLEWFKNQMRYFCQKYPTYSFNLNIHPQQFLHESTWEFLKQLKIYSHQIIIEITEKPMILKNIDDTEMLFMEEFIHKIKNIGFNVCFDDIGCGQNSLEFVSKNIDAISCLKFSLHSFRHIEVQTVLLFLHAWHNLATTYNIRMVVEGIEDKCVAQTLFERGLHLQQGYYWAKSVNL